MDRFWSSLAMSPTALLACFSDSVFSLSVITLVTLSLTYFLRKRFKKKQDLKGKVVLVTGASSGIGEAICRNLARRGCKLILAARSMDKLNILKRSLCDDYGLNDEYVTPFYLDLEDHTELPVMADSIIKIYGCIDVLINNAGILCHDRVDKTDLSVYKRLMDVNFFGQVVLTKAILPSMIASGGGTIVAISSLLGRFSKSNSSAYAASKHALQAFCDSLRSESCHNNILVVVVSPGYVKTEITAHAFSGSGRPIQYVSREIERGIDVSHCAEQIIQGIDNCETDVLIAPFQHRMVVYLRTLMPSLFHHIIAKYE